MKTYFYREIPHVRILGRTREGEQSLTLFWSGSGLEFNARTTELWIRYHADFRFYEPWIDILVDQERTQRIMLMRGTHDVCIWRSNEALTNTLAGEEIPVRKFTILRDTQAMPLDDKMLLQIEAAMIEGEFYPIQEPKVKIELIGDSITSGEGCCGIVGEQAWNSGCFDIVQSYGFQMAKLLQADFRILSQSGWGVYRSFDGNPRAVLPRYYDKICGVLSGEMNREIGAKDKWDHASWKPTVIVINLGTNDAGYLASIGEISEEDRAGLGNAVTQFLLHLRAVQPESLLLWCYGIFPQSNQKIDLEVNHILSESVKTASTILEDDRIHYVRLPAMRPDEFGSRSHPGPKAHKRVARVLADQIERLLE